MKKITFLFIFIFSLGYAQNTVSVSQTDFTRAFVNVFNESDGSFAGFGFDYGIDILAATFPSVNSISFVPNGQIWADNDETPCSESFCSTWNPTWFDAPEDPSKIIEATLFAEPAVGTLDSDDLDFIGTVDALTLNGAYTVDAFIKIIGPAPSFNLILDRRVTLNATGDYTVSATSAEVGTGNFVQYGFIMTGLIGDPDVVPTLGSILLSEKVLSTNNLEVNNFRVSPNPSNNVWNIEGSNSVIDNVEVYDLLGKRVLNLSPNSQEVRIDASGLKTGIYLAKLASEGATKTIKLVKN